MALSQSGMSAWISIEGVVAPMYGVQVQPSSATCWIASKAGKKFSVNWKVDQRPFPTQARVIVDGVPSAEHTMLDAVNYPGRQNTVELSFVRTSACTQRDLMFTEVHKTDGVQGSPSLWGADPTIGAIVVELWRYEVMWAELDPCIPSSSSLQHPSMLSGGHCVQYGEEYQSPAPFPDVALGFRPEDDPYMRFTFYYRPIDVLRAHGIVPDELKFVLYQSVEGGRVMANRRRGHSRSSGFKPMTTGHDIGAGTVVSTQRKTCPRRTKSARSSITSTLREPQAEQN